MKLKTILVITTLFFAISCQNTATQPKTPNIKKGVAPVADKEVAVFEMENSTAYGKITVELYSNIAPEMVKRFKELANEGFYNGTTFHRINSNVIQGGDPLSKDNDPDNDGTGNSGKPNVVAEFSDILYDVGILGAARRGDSVNSQNSQFFITLKRTPEFDQKYTIFGKVIEGMSEVRTIAGANREGEHPVEPIRIKSVSIQTKP